MSNVGNTWSHWDWLRGCHWTVAPPGRIVSQYAYLPKYLPAYLPNYIPTQVSPIYLPAYLPKCLPA